MDFHEEVRAIHNNWKHGRISKATAIVEFENLMHSNGLLPDDHEIDRDTSDQILASLLNQAAVLSPTAMLTARDILTEMQDTYKAVHRSFALVPSFQCHACRKFFPSLFIEAQIKEDNGSTVSPGEIIKLDAPRCEACMREYLDAYVFKTKSRPVPASPVFPMTFSEEKFFRVYEEQMKKIDK